MTADYHHSKDLLSPKLEELSHVVDVSMNTTCFGRCISMNEDNSSDHTDQYVPSYSISTVKSDEHLSSENIRQVNEDVLDFSFNPKDWLITDSVSGKSRPPRQNEFLYLLLEDSRYSSYLCWLDRNEGLFKIHQPERVTTLWTKVKNRQTNGIMDYDTFARGIRYYYKSGSMIKTYKKYTFRFKTSMNSII